MQRRRIRREPRLAGSARCAVLQHHITQCALIKSQRIDRAGAVGAPIRSTVRNCSAVALCASCRIPGQLLFARGSRIGPPRPGRPRHSHSCHRSCAGKSPRRTPPLTQRERNYRGQVIVGMLWVCRQPDQPSEIGLRFAPGEPSPNIPRRCRHRRGPTPRSVRLPLSARRYSNVAGAAGHCLRRAGSPAGSDLARMRQANTDFAPAPTPGPGVTTVPG